MCTCIAYQLRLLFDTSVLVSMLCCFIPPMGVHSLHNRMVTKEGINGQFR